MSVENPNSNDFRDALDEEREKTAAVNCELAASKNEVRRLSDKVSKVTHHRTGLLEEHDRLRDEMNEMKTRYNDLVDHFRAEKKRLRDRRDEFGSYCRSRGLAKMARLVQKRLTRIQANINDNKAIEPKYLEFNQIRGNIKTLEALVETKEIEILSPGLLKRLDDDLKAFGVEVDAHEITDIHDGDFDAYTLFDNPSEVPHFSVSIPSLEDGEEHGDDKGDEDIQPMEQVDQSQAALLEGPSTVEAVNQPEVPTIEVNQAEAALVEAVHAEG